MATVLPTTGVREHVPGNLGQSDRIILGAEYLSNAVQAEMMDAADCITAATAAGCASVP